MVTNFLFARGTPLVAPRRIPLIGTLLAALCFCSALPSQLQAQSITETIEQVSPKIVKIFGAGGRKNLYAYGSGFLVSPQGHIATVWSHILDGDAVTVVLHDGRRYTGLILGAEPQLDLAIIKIDAEDLPHFDLAAETGEAGPGATVLAFSNVFKVATGDEPVSVIHGVIAARTNLSASRGVFEAPYTGPVYVVDSVTNNSGAAGGVLTTRDGRLLGMLGKELRNNVTHTWLNYVVPMSQLQSPIEEIVTGNFKPRSTGDEEAKVMVRRFSPRDFGLVMVPDVVSRTPAYVDRVVPGSAAEAAGLKTEDLVVFVGERIVPSCRVLLEEFGRLEPGDPLTLVVRRGDKLETVQLTTPRTSPRADSPTDSQ
ncbi:MAG: serine protease [Planctomycetales bacterium 12-60-4]|nr:MAG: serine protease [Planctomycetales bacterium 12-60-4]